MLQEFPLVQMLAGKPAARACAARLGLPLALLVAAPALGQQSAAELQPLAAEAVAPAVRQTLPSTNSPALQPAQSAAPAGTAAVPPALQSAPALPASLPAGVCPVISDYLLQQCQQNAQDPMCSFVPGT